MRRLLALLGIIGLALAGLVLPAAAQSTGSSVPTPPTITALNPNCSPPTRNLTVGLTGTSGPGNGGSIEVRGPDGQFIGEGGWSDGDGDGRWTAQVAVSAGQSGYYRILARDYYQQASNTAILSVPCRSPQLTFSPTCSTPGTAQTLTVSGNDFLPNGTATVQYDWNGQAAAQTRIRISIDAAGRFATTPASSSTPFTVTPPDRPVPVRATDGGLVVVVNWQPCPPPGATTTSTTAPPPDTVPDPGPEPDPDPGPDPTTTAPPFVPTPDSPPVTLPPTIELPPPTPGATLTLSPKIGPVGFVTGVTGTGFPPGPVVLVWTPGIGSTTTIAGPDGTISTRVLILPGDRLGPRALVGTGGAVTAFDAFLVVPSTVQPSGQEVSQINRIRRFNNR